MADSLNLSISEQSSFVDKCNIFGNSKVYPESYQNFQKSIENISLKSELLLKCIVEFEKRISIDLPNSLAPMESLINDLKLSLIFTGAIKSGRSSIINILLNTRILPTSIIGSGCCVKIRYPKSESKKISIGMFDLDGWEIEKYSDLDISVLPTKIESLQHIIEKKYCTKNHKYTRRIHVEFPHWLLKNINIFECPAIDGIYSFDEPFELITRTGTHMIIHVIDATNGLMEWDRTFLAKLQYTWPHLPVFFIINHVDINSEILIRDNDSRFQFLAESISTELYETESESPEASFDESFFIDGKFNTNIIISHQKHLITKCINQINKLGYILENKISTFYVALSAKEFIEILKGKKTVHNCYWEMVEIFFQRFDVYIIKWLESILFISLVELKGRVTGIVDAVQTQMLISLEMSLDVSRDSSLQKIRRSNNRIKTEFMDIPNDYDKHVATILKEQLKKHHAIVSKSLPISSTENNSQIIRIMKPMLRENLEKILLETIYDCNLNDEINLIFESLLKRIENILNKRRLNVYQYISRLFHSLQITIVYPLISCIPQEIIQSENKWYKELLNNATQRFFGKNMDPLGAINDINVTSITKTSKLALGNVLKQLQIFTMKYEESYKKAQIWCFPLVKVNQETFNELIFMDFVIKLIEKPLQKETEECKPEDLVRMTTFSKEFFIFKGYMVKCINIQSITSLSGAISVIFFHRICQPSSYIMSHEKYQLLNSRECLLYYPKMDYDILNAIKNGTLWEVNDAIGILKQLANAVKYLLLYYQYFQIDLSPENIMLKKDDRGLHECVLYPFSKSGETQCFSGKIKNNLHAATYQLGIVLCWLLSNDVRICEIIDGDQGCSITEFHKYLSRKTFVSLQKTNLITLAVNCVLKPELFANIKVFTNELDNIKEYIET